MLQALPPPNPRMSKLISEGVFITQKRIYGLLESATENNASIPLKGLTETLEQSKNNLIDIYMEILAEYDTNSYMQYVKSPVFLALITNFEIFAITVGKNKLLTKK